MLANFETSITIKEKVVNGTAVERTITEKDTDGKETVIYSDYKDLRVFANEKHQNPLDKFLLSLYEQPNGLKHRRGDICDTFGLFGRRRAQPLNFKQKLFDVLFKKFFLSGIAAAVDHIKRLNVKDKIDRGLL